MRLARPGRNPAAFVEIARRRPPALRNARVGDVEEREPVPLGQRPGEQGPKEARYPPRPAAPSPPEEPGSLGCLRFRQRDVVVVESSADASSVAFASRLSSAEVCFFRPTRSTDGRPTCVSTISPLHSRRFISSTSWMVAASFSGVGRYSAKWVPNLWLTCSITTPKSVTTWSKRPTTNPDRARHEVP